MKLPQYCKVCSEQPIEEIAELDRSGIIGIHFEGLNFRKRLKLCLGFTSACLLKRNIVSKTTFKQISINFLSKESKDE